MAAQQISNPHLKVKKVETVSKGLRLVDKVLPGI